MRNLLIVTLLAVFALSACNKKSEGKTKGGNSYVLYKNSKGDAKKVEPETFAKVQIYQYFNDSLMGSTRKFGKAEYMRLPNPAEVPGRWPGYLEGLQLISVGDSIVVFENMDSIPLPPNMAWVKSLSYHIVLEDVLTKEDRQKITDEEKAKMEAKRAELMKELPGIEANIKENLALFNGNKLGDKLKTTASGLQYIVMSEGDGTQVKAGEKTKVHYYGALTDGKRFDDSFSRGEPFELEVGAQQVIPGWDEGLQLFKRGTKALLFIPYKLGYGEQGNPPVIPAKSTLVFYTDIQK